MRQELCNLAVLVGGQPHQDILEVGVRVMPVEPGTLDQAHDGSGALARAQRSGEQPVRAAHGHGPDLVFHPVVVDGQLPVIQETHERAPAPQAVVKRLGRSRAVQELAALEHRKHPANPY